MTRFTIVMMIAFVSGCGAQISRSDLTELRNTVEAQRRLIGRLQAERLVGGNGVAAGLDPAEDETETAQPTPAPVVTPPAPRAPVARPMPMMPRRPVAATPQTWGNLHGPPPMTFGRCPAVMNLHIVNRTDHFVSVLLDGEMTQNGGAMSTLPHIPPRQRLEVCLERLGRHTISGALYTVRDGQTTPLGVRFSRPLIVDENTSPYDYQRYAITDSEIRRGRLP